MFEAPQVYFRLSKPYAQYSVYGVLTEENGSYTGTAEVMTSCGRSVMSVSTKVD